MRTWIASPLVVIVLLLVLIGGWFFWDQFLHQIAAQLNPVEMRSAKAAGVLGVFFTSIIGALFLTGLMEILRGRVSISLQENQASVSPDKSKHDAVPRESRS